MVQNMSVDIPRPTAVVENLEPVTNYNVQLFASDGFGLSFPSETLTVWTLPEAPSGEPLKVTAVSVGPTAIVVKWEPPELAKQHGEILGYQITATIQSYAMGDSSKKRNVTTVVDQKWELRAELKDLVPNSQYKITVKAYNSAGMGPASPSLYIQTPEGGMQHKKNHTAY